MTTTSRSRATAGRIMGALLLLLASVPGQAALGYGGDTHYYLRYAEALESCFTWDEAHLIASADYMTDKNRTTTAEKNPAKKHNKINWHAFSRSPERFNELWERALNETDPELQLVKLGQFTHFASDWEAHYGFGVRMGHGLPTLMAKDPDSLGNSEMNNLRMIDQTMYHLMEICVAWDRMPADETDANRALVDTYLGLVNSTILQELFDINTPRWKKLGKRWKMGKQILAQNHLLVEQLIQERAPFYRTAKLPADFTPGDPERGLPPPIGIRYDKDGDLKAILGVEVELMPEYDGDPSWMGDEEDYEERRETGLVDDLEEQVQGGADIDLEANVELRPVSAELTGDGWLVDVEIENLGDAPSSGGQLSLYVLDAVSEEQVGQAEQPISAVAGQETLRMQVPVPADPGPPGRDVLMGLSLELADDDLSVDNNDAWFVPWPGGVTRGERHRKKRKETYPGGAVEVLGQPDMWIDGNGDAFLVVTAFVPGGDSARRLKDLEVRVNDGLIEARYHKGHADLVWFSVPDLRRRTVPGRTAIWVPRDKDVCRFDDAPYTLTLTVSASGARSTTRSFTVPDEIVQEARDYCATRERER